MYHDNLDQGERTLSFSLMASTLIVTLISVCSLALDARAASFKRWRAQLAESCTLRQESGELWVEELLPNQILVSLYPQKMSVTALDWVGRGGVIMLALDERSANGSQALLKALDLSPIPLRDEQRGLRGAWPFPQSQLGAHQTSSPFTFPWITWSPLTFEEGESWLKEGIAPIAIDEEGRSLAYRVRYGKGIITLFGDADALSDQLMSASENRRFTQSLTWWLTKKKRDQREPCIMSWVSTRGALKSRREEQSLKHQLSELGQDFKEWWREIAQAQIFDYQSLKIINLISILCFVLLLNMLTSRREWKRRFTLRRD